MSVPADNSAVPEHDSHSDSDWLDIASTDRDSDDNDSVCSSRETDHEDLSRSRSRRSSLSYGSSRDGDVDAWEGLIDDSADEGTPSDVLAPNHHVPSPSQRPTTADSNPARETSPEEILVNEGLDQSMISTLSSSRSSSLHASTVHNSSRDLRLSFPDPITSSCREPLSTSYEEIQPNSIVLSSPVNSESPTDARQGDDEAILSAFQTTSSQPQLAFVPSPSGPELKVFLCGISTASKWSIINRLLQKVAHGAGLTISPDLDNLQGSTRHLIVSGSLEHDPAFPRVITVLDRTHHPHDTVDDLALMDSSCIRPLAVVFVPCRPLRLPERVLRLPVLISPSDLGELHDLNIVEANSRDTWDAFNFPDHQLLRITAAENSPVVDKDSIDVVDPSRAYRAFSHLWSSDNDTSKGMMTSTHALTIIAILSLILGVLVRAALPISLQQFTPSTIAVLNSNSTSGFLWQMLRPAPYRERLSPSPAVDSSVMVISSSLKDFSLSVFRAESTAMTLSHANPTNIWRVIPSTLSERSEFTKDLVLQPPRSVLSPDNGPKSLSVLPEASPTGQPLADSSTSSVVKECATVAYSIANQEMQDIFDALDALVLAISRQTQIFLAQATTFIEESAKHLEKSVESFETIKETLHARNEHARKRAKEFKEIGTKWLYEASEAVAAGAQFSKGRAKEMAESVAHRAQRARGRAKEMAAEIQDFWSEYERVEAFGIDAWYTHTKRWEEWVRRVEKQGQKGTLCKPSNRKLKSGIFC